MFDCEITTWVADPTAAMSGPCKLFGTEWTLTRDGCDFHVASKSQLQTNALNVIMQDRECLLNANAVPAHAADHFGV